MRGVRLLFVVMLILLFTGVCSQAVQISPFNPQGNLISGPILPVLDVEEAKACSPELPDSDGDGIQDGIEVYEPEISAILNESIFFLTQVEAKDGRIDFQGLSNFENQLIIKVIDSASNDVNSVNNVDILPFDQTFHNFGSPVNMFSVFEESGEKVTVKLSFNAPVKFVCSKSINCDYNNNYVSFDIDSEVNLYNYENVITMGLLDDNLFVGLNFDNVPNSHLIKSGSLQIFNDALSVDFINFDDASNIQRVIDVSLRKTDNFTVTLNLNFVIGNSKTIEKNRLFSKKVNAGMYYSYKFTDHDFDGNGVYESVGGRYYDYKSLKRPFFCIQPIGYNNPKNLIINDVKQNFVKFSGTTEHYCYSLENEFFDSRHINSVNYSFDYGISTIDSESGTVSINFSKIDVPILRYKEVGDYFKFYFENDPEEYFDSLDASEYEAFLSPILGNNFLIDSAFYSIELTRLDNLETFVSIENLENVDKYYLKIYKNKKIDRVFGPAISESNIYDP